MLYIVVYLIKNILYIRSLLSYFIRIGFFCYVFFPYRIIFVLELCYYGLDYTYYISTC